MKFKILNFKFKIVSGFTLMELLIAVSIIGILVAIGTVSYATITKQSRDTKRKSDIEQLRSALEMYRADNGFYPDIGGGLSIDVANLSSVLVPQYLRAIPADPKVSRPYMYEATNDSGVNYYGYCLSAFLEAENPTDTCSPTTDYNYGARHP